MRGLRFGFWLAGLFLPLSAWLARRGRLRPLRVGLFIAAAFAAITYFVSPMPYTAARDFTRNGQPAGYHHFWSSVVVGLVTATPCALIIEWLTRKMER
ncbi:MAG: hypothetical protein QOG33_895 [Gaiellales bacterium]|jgi:H+/gluconate symporter-like permease|nr:hypothetical protein [Gaiellales bacterium]